MERYYVGFMRFSPDDITHHGVKGQKWGVRRYMNPDGTLTPEGKRRYGTIERFNASQKQNNGVSGRNGSKHARSGSFISRHKKGLAIAGGLLAAGVGAVVISKLVGGNKTSAGSKAVNKVLSGSGGYNSKGTVFSVQGSKGTISGYYSPGMADYMRKMNGGALPGSHAKNFSSTTKEYYDYITKRR